MRRFAPVLCALVVALTAHCKGSADLAGGGGATSKPKGTATAGGNSAGTAGGNSAGTAGGNSAGTAGGNSAGTAGGNSAGTAGGNPAGTAGGNPAGTAGGNSAGTAGATAGGVGTNTSGATGSGVGSTGGSSTLPPNAVQKGSFTAYAVPAKPAEYEDYKIFIEVSLPSKPATYKRKDLSGKLKGTDDYEQDISDDGDDDSFKFLGTKAVLVISVPGSYSHVKDTIDIHSDLLNESQQVVLTFQ